MPIETMSEAVDNPIDEVDVSKTSLPALTEDAVAAIPPTDEAVPKTIVKMTSRALKLTNERPKHAN